MNVDLTQHVRDFHDEHRWLPGHLPYLLDKTWATETIILEEVNREVDALHTKKCIPQTAGVMSDYELAFYDCFRLLTRYGYITQEDES